MDRRGLVFAVLAALVLAGCSADKAEPAPRAAEVAPPPPSPAQQVAVTAADGLTLEAGWRPATTKARAGLLLVPMLGRGQADYAGFSQALAPYNIATLAVSLRGNGGSPAPGGKDYRGFKTADWLSTQADLAAGLKDLRERVGQAPLAIVGASIGANLAVRYAADHPGQVKGLVLLSPGLDYHGIGLLEPLAKLKDLPLLVASATDDAQAVSAATLQERYGAKRLALLTYDGDDHGTDLLASHPQIVTKVLDWLSQLK